MSRIVLTRKMIHKLAQNIICFTVYYRKANIFILDCFEGKKPRNGKYDIMSLPFMSDRQNFGDV